MGSHLRMINHPAHQYHFYLPIQNLFRWRTFYWWNRRFRQSCLRRHSCPCHLHPRSRPLPHHQSPWLFASKTCLKIHRTLIFHTKKTGILMKIRNIQLRHSDDRDLDLMKRAIHRMIGILFSYQREQKPYLSISRIYVIGQSQMTCCCLSNA